MIFMKFGFGFGEEGGRWTLQFSADDIQLSLAEVKLAWIVHIIAAIQFSGELEEVFDAKLSARVWQLITVKNSGWVSQSACPLLQDGWSVGMSATLRSLPKKVWASGTTLEGQTPDAYTPPPSRHWVNCKMPHMAAANAGRIDHTQPGPIDTSVLKLQPTHRSEAIWNGQDLGALTCRGRTEEFSNREPMVDDRVVDIIKALGLEGLLRQPGRELDHGLITAFVERWRPETHTFHMPHGEITITLQDVEVILGLPVDGDAITESTQKNWMQQVANPLSPNAEEDELHKYARCYILALLGDTIFMDKSGDRVHLMWPNFAAPPVTAPVARPFIPTTPAMLKNAGQYQQPTLGSQLYPFVPSGNVPAAPITSQPGSVPGHTMPHVVAPTPSLKGFMPVNSAVVQRSGMGSMQPHSPTQAASVQPTITPAAPPPTLQTVDTSNVAVHQKSVIATLTRLFNETSEALGGSRANPAKKREIEDNSRKLGALFAKLNSGDISKNASDKLVQLCQALDGGDFSTTLQIQVLLPTSEWDECNFWLATLKRMIKTRQNVRIN
uniref:Uncharacterized protein n=1 Tax=Quercus lobata TaxID=97700 RepID=A0A7N2LHI2_QUELO